MNFGPEYTKIMTAFKRDKRNVIIPGDWTLPEFEYLQDNPWTWTEKVDGCVAYGTSITMADGTLKPVSQVKEGDFVLGMDKEVGKVVPALVEKTHRNGTTDAWLKVKGTKTGAGKGNPYCAITCTPEHRFWVQETGYVRADELVPGTRINYLRSDYGLTPVQRSVLLGKLLGDGSIARQHASSWSIGWGHSEPQYTAWTRRAVGEDLAGNESTVVSGYGTTIHRCRTVQSYAIREEFSDFIDGNGKRTLPKRVADDLDPIALAFWYMDDGSLSHTEGQEDRATIASNAFTPEECLILQRGLERLGLHSVLFESGGFMNLRFNSEDAERLFLLIAPYVPEAMQGKLPERYRGHDGWLPSPGTRPFRQKFTGQVVTSVEPFEPQVKMRYDLTTSTHNYFAGGVLVHNCNIRLHWDGEGVTVGGRTDNAQLPSPLVAALKPLTEDTARWQAVFPDSPDVTVYGEGYGAKIQSGGQYRADQALILFDVKIGPWWLSDENISDVAGKLGLETVPRLGDLTLNKAWTAITEGRVMSYWPNARAEGLVGRPAVPLFTRKGERLIVKMKVKDWTDYKRREGEKT